jgi:excisionase family DNA binding protein
MPANMSTFPAQRPPENGRHQMSESGNGFEPLLDSVQAAELLRIHPKTLQRMARNREIVATQIGKLWRFRASELNQWLRSKKTAS